MQLKIHTGVREEAARWHARLHAHDCTESDRAAFRCWESQNRRHREAYQAIEAVSQRVDNAALDPRLQALADEAFATSQLPTTGMKRGWQVPATLAASVAIAAATVLYLGPAHIPLQSATVYEAGSERSTISLEDGTRVELDVNTRIDARIGTHERVVRLLKGRAMFDVMHDASRPFSVDADDARTTALGTRFQIEQGDAAVIITLAEGSVKVEDSGNEEFYERLQPGEQLNVNTAKAQYEKKRVDVLAATGWTRGRLVFHSTPLRDAIREVNRYTDVKVHLGDPTIAQLPVGGNFVAGDSDSVVAALMEALPLRAVRDEHEILLFRRYATDVVADQP
jgi:transmembrane sensor